MGSDAHVLVLGGGPRLAEFARRRLLDLEMRWTRFRDDSELSTVNRSAGEPVRVSSATLRVIAASVKGWHATDGLFDPTVIDAMTANGYDRSFELVASAAPTSGGCAGPAPGCAGVVLDDATSTVALPVGVRLDLGGIGKGLAADLLVEEVIGAGAAGVCVNVGGDVRVAGDSPVEPGWVVGVEHPCRPGVELSRLALRDEALVTSSRVRRRWATASGERHHLLDPRSGVPADAGVTGVSVIAKTAADAEVLSKVVAVGGLSRGIPFLERSNASAIVVLDDGTVVRTAGIGAREV